MGDETELVDAGNQCPNKAKVDEGDELGAPVPRLPPYKCHNRPYCRKDRDYEEGAASRRISIAPIVTSVVLGESYSMDAGVIRP